MNSTQFDTIYHEHFSYLSLISVDKIFSAHNLKLFDVEQIPIGGSTKGFSLDIKMTKLNKKVIASKT